MVIKHRDYVMIYIPLDSHGDITEFLDAIIVSLEIFIQVVACCSEFIPQWNLFWSFSFSTIWNKKLFLFEIGPCLAYFLFSLSFLEHDCKISIFLHSISFALKCLWSKKQLLTHWMPFVCHTTMQPYFITAMNHHQSFQNGYTGSLIWKAIKREEEEECYSF